MCSTHKQKFANQQGRKKTIGIEIEREAGRLLKLEIFIRVGSTVFVLLYFSLAGNIANGLASVCRECPVCFAVLTVQYLILK